MSWLEDTIRDLCSELFDCLQYAVQLVDVFWHAFDSAIVIHTLGFSGLF